MKLKPRKFADTPLYKVENNANGNPTLWVGNTCECYAFKGFGAFDTAIGEIKEALNPDHDDPWFIIGGDKQFITNGEEWYGIKYTYHPSKKESFARLTAVKWRLTKGDQELVLKLIAEIFKPK